MPALSKQSIINLLIDSPLRDPIKINLVDIVNNTKDADLQKVFPTVTKELEIFQKATARRLKLADDTIKKLSEESSTQPPQSPSAPVPPPPPPADESEEDSGLKVPPLNLPPLPKPLNNEQYSPLESPTPQTAPTPTIEPSAPPAPPPLPPTPEKSTNANEAADEEALKEIQKELDSLKSEVEEDAAATPYAVTPTPDKPTA